MFDENEPAAGRIREVSVSSVHACIKNTEALRKINKRILYFLDRLPLDDQRDIVQLYRLIEEQERTVKERIKGHVPARIAVFNENERYRAMHLRRRFRYAKNRDKIRPSE